MTSPPVAEHENQSTNWPDVAFYAMWACFIFAFAGCEATVQLAKAKIEVAKIEREKCK